MNRRDFITLLSGAVPWPLAARAQQRGKLPTIGYMGANTPSIETQWFPAFSQRLRELGWIDGSTVEIAPRWAESRIERATEIVAEFIRLRVDVIVTGGDNKRCHGEASDSRHPDHFRGGGRSGWHRPRRKFGPTGRQRYWPFEPVN